MGLGLSAIQKASLGREFHTIIIREKIINTIYQPSIQTPINLENKDKNKVDITSMAYRRDRLLFSMIFFHLVAIPFHLHVLTSVWIRVDALNEPSVLNGC